MSEDDDDDRQDDEPTEEAGGDEKKINDPLTRSEAAERAPRREFGQDPAD